MNAAASRSSNMADDSDELPEAPRQGSRLRFELIFASLWLAFGLFLLPALVFWVGAAMLGAYGENGGLGTFYADFYGDLADGSGRAWSLALGPLVLIYVLRAIFIGVKPSREGHESDANLEPAPRRPAPPKKEASKRPAGKSRIEPRMGGE